MTLLVYKDGILAADTGATRNDSRELAHKIFRFANRNHTLFIAYAGELGAIAAHRYMIEQQMADGNLRYKEPTPEWECRGIAVLRDENTGKHSVFSFSCFDGSTSRGVWQPEYDNMVTYGWDSAVTSALAINHVCPHYTAWQIIKSVAEINSGCDTLAGVDWVGVETDTIVNEKV